MAVAVLPSSAEYTLFSFKYQFGFFFLCHCLTHSLTSLVSCNDISPSHLSCLVSFIFSVFHFVYLCRCFAGRTFSELEYPWRLIYNTRRSVVVVLRHSRWDLVATIAITYKIWTSIQCRSSWMMSWDTLVSQRIGGKQSYEKMLFFWYQREIEFSALNNAKSSAFVLSARYSRACSVLDRVSFSSYSFYSIHSFPLFPPSVSFTDTSNILLDYFPGRSNWIPFHYIWNLLKWNHRLACTIRFRYMRASGAVSLKFLRAISSSLFQVSRWVMF